MKPAHVLHGIGASAPGNLTGAGRVRQPVKGGGTTVPDPVCPVSPIEGAGESLWRRARRKERSTPALYRHWSAIARLGPHPTPAGREGGTRRGPLSARPCRTPARRGAMPKLF